MKSAPILTLACSLALAVAGSARDAEPAPGKDAKPAPQPDPKELLAKHQEGASGVADKQDELSADVQQLTIEQTIPKVIELFKEVEGIMDEATDWLTEYDTGGRTIAAQTEVIEKIFEAAKQRQQQGGSQSGGAMMDMMEKMMEQDEGKQPGDKPGKKPGDKGGEGMTGDSDAANDATAGAGDAKAGQRRVPKAAGSSGAPLPEEFRKALDAYNRGLEEKVK
jgi:hypothetical protein